MEIVVTLVIVWAFMGLPFSDPQFTSSPNRRTYWKKIALCGPIAWIYAVLAAWESPKDYWK